MKTLPKVKSLTPTRIPSSETVLTLRIKGYAVRVSREDPSPAIFQPSHPLFKAVEAYFNDWLKNYATEDDKAMYTGSYEEMNGGSYLSAQGAIEEGVQALIQYARESNFTLLYSSSWHKVDLEAVFQTV